MSTCGYSCQHVGRQWVPDAHCPEHSWAAKPAAPPNDPLTKEAEASVRLDGDTHCVDDAPQSDQPEQGRPLDELNELIAIADRDGTLDIRPGLKRIAAKLSAPAVQPPSDRARELAIELGNHRCGKPDCWLEVNNLECLVAIIESALSERGAPEGLREAASKFAARVRERCPEWFEERDTDFSEADHALRATLAQRTPTAPGKRGK